MSEEEDIIESSNTTTSDNEKDKETIADIGIEVSVGLETSSNETPTTTTTTTTTTTPSTTLNRPKRNIIKKKLYDDLSDDDEFTKEPIDRDDASSGILEIASYDKKRKKKDTNKKQVEENEEEAEEEKNDAILEYNGSEEEEEDDIEKEFKKRTSSTPSKKKKKDKEVKSTPLKKKKKPEYETAGEVQLDNINLYSLGALVKTKVSGGREMPSTIEKRKQKSQDAKKPAASRRPQISYQSSAVDESQGAEDDPGTEFEVVDGRIVPKIRDTPLSTTVIYDQPADYDTNAFINSNSFSKRGENPSRKWTSDEIDRLYDALRKYGTDFSIIESVFEGRTRTQLKKRFKLEERRNPLMIRELLSDRRPINLQDFQRESEMVRQMKAKRAEEKAVEEANKHNLPGFDEEDDILDEEDSIERENRKNLLNGALARKNGRDDSEEVIIDSTQSQQQQQYYDQYDFYGFGSDRFDVGDEYY